MKLRHVLLVFVVLLLGGVGLFLYGVHHYLNTTVPNAYAVWWVGGMVVDYLEQNEDQWPQSWDDLRPVYDQHIQEVGQPWSFEELKTRVVIRWDVDVERVRRLPEPPDDLIYLSDGGDEYWSGQEPNTMVHDYLTEPSPVDHPQPSGRETRE